MNRAHYTAIAFAAFFFLAAPFMVASDTVDTMAGDTDDDGDDALQQDEARQAVKQGLVLPLDVILAEVRKKFAGDIIEIEFEKDDGKFIYEIELIRPDGHLVEIKIDAKTKAVIETEED